MSILENSNQCFVCGKGLEHLDGCHPSQCWGAVTFQSPGNYGSTVYDPMGGSGYLVINICDECLTSRAHLVLKRIVITPQPHNDYKQWDPNEAAL